MVKRGLSLFRAILSAPMIVKACSGGGVLAGAAIGMALSAPSGLVASVLVGAGVGAIAGVVIDREEQRASVRTRELDAILSMGGGGIVASPMMPKEMSAAEREQELRAWVTEWMTPQPPHVG